jgi:hypothetical protein
MHTSSQRDKYLHQYLGTFAYGCKGQLAIFPNFADSVLSRKLYVSRITNYEYLQGQERVGKCHSRKTLLPTNMNAIVSASEGTHGATSIPSGDSRAWTAGGGDTKYQQFQCGRRKQWRKKDEGMTQRGLGPDMSRWTMKGYLNIVVIGVGNAVGTGQTIGKRGKGDMVVTSR